MNPYFRSLLTLRAPAWFGFVPLIRTALMVCLLANAANVQAQQQGWSATGSLVAARSRGHSATLLANGKVLVVGGITGPYPYYTGSKSAELYDPATGEWSATGSLSAPRADHIAVRLADGKVLVAGGWGALNPVSATDHREISAEIYDPDSGGWSAAGNIERRAQRAHGDPTCRRKGAGHGRFRRWLHDS